MTIGTALIVIAVLYLIDKHHLWKKAVITLIAGAALTAVAWAGYIWWDAWSVARHLKQMQVAADADCAEVGKGYHAVGVDWEMPHGTACEAQQIDWSKYQEEDHHYSWEPYEYVPMIAPDGKHLAIPRSRVNDALKAGFIIDSNENLKRFGPFAPNKAPKACPPHAKVQFIKDDQRECSYDAKGNLKSQIIKFEGHIHAFPGDATDAEILKALASYRPAR